jgi:hypothetical protein
MILEKFFGEEEFFGWRCVVCGDIVDQVILANRTGKKIKKTIRGKIV